MDIFLLFFFLIFLEGTWSDRDCTPETNDRKFPNAYDCQKFYICSDGQLKEEKCSMVQLFNPTTLKCDWRWKVTCLPIPPPTSSATVQIPVSTLSSTSSAEHDTNRIPTISTTLSIGEKITSSSTDQSANQPSSSPPTTTLLIDDEPIQNNSINSTVRERDITYSIISTVPSNDTSSTIIGPNDETWSIIAVQSDQPSTQESSLSSMTLSYSNNTQHSSISKDEQQTVPTTPYQITTSFRTISTSTNPSIPEVNNMVTTYVPELSSIQSTDKVPTTFSSTEAAKTSSSTVYDSYTYPSTEETPYNLTLDDTTTTNRNLTGYTQTSGSIISTATTENLFDDSTPSVSADAISSSDPFADGWFTRSFVASEDHTATESVTEIPVVDEGSVRLACIRSQSFLLLPFPGREDLFVMCVRGLPVPMNCPPGLIFNANASGCDWPIEA